MVFASLHKSPTFRRQGERIALSFVLFNLMQALKFQFLFLPFHAYSWVLLFLSIWMFFCSKSSRDPIGIIYKSAWLWFCCSLCLFFFFDCWVHLHPALRSFNILFLSWLTGEAMHCVQPSSTMLYSHATYDEDCARKELFPPSLISCISQNEISSLLLLLFSFLKTCLPSCSFLFCCAIGM